MSQAQTTVQAALGQRIDILFGGSRRRRKARGVSAGVEKITNGIDKKRH
jgi:hypothetical protein